MADINVLRRARELVATGWHRRSYAATVIGGKSEYGQLCSPLHDFAVCWCARGALMRAVAESMGIPPTDGFGGAAVEHAEEDAALFVARHGLPKIEGHDRFACDLALHNDRKGTTQADVLGWFDAAIAAAELIAEGVAA